MNSQEPRIPETISQIPTPIVQKSSVVRETRRKKRPVVDNSMSLTEKEMKYLIQTLKIIISKTRHPMSTK
eukprot:UN28595